MASKNYKIIDKIENDAPFGDINWCTISFLTSRNIAQTNSIDVKGFKLHTGQNTLELAKDDIKRIKENHQNLDVFLIQMGKLYSWDDISKSESIEYENEKLNELEKTRRESMDRVKLLNEQIINESKTVDTPNVRKDKQMEKLRKKLYEKGMITKKELDMMEQANRTSSKAVADLREKIDECYLTDYLQQNEEISLKYGCISLFSPRKIGGLETFCFKIRGLFQLKEQAEKRCKKLGKTYPYDNIYLFEIGKWCVYSDDEIDEITKMKYLNYMMKCYLDNIVKEKEEFENRKKLSKTQQTYQEKKEKKGKSKKSNKGARQELKQEKISPEKGEDESNIQDLIDKLEDAELKNVFPSQSTKSLQVDLN